MILLDGAPVASLEDYVERGGGVALGIAVGSGPEHVLDELESSGLRGRGGAGFSTALKWRSIVAGGAEAGERFAQVSPLPFRLHQRRSPQRDSQ